MLERYQLEGDRFSQTFTDLAIRLALLALFIYLSVTLVRPFISVIIWSVVVAVALYPVFEWVAAKLGGRRRLAAAVTTIFSLLVVLGPATWLVLGVIESIRLLLDQLDSSTLALPQPAQSVKDWPIVGEKLFQFWNLAATNIKAAAAAILPQLKPVGGVLLHIAAEAGTGTLKFLTAIVVAGFLFVPGPSLVSGVASFTRRVASERGEQFVKLAGTTIRTVAQGVIGISALQALLAGLGLMVAGVPATSLLTTAILILGIIQIGPALVILPLVLWSWTVMDTAPALLFTIYMLSVGALDNILKPLIMRRGLTTPTLVILIGLIGGTLSYGVTGLFLGPIVLSVLWELGAAWISSADDKRAAVVS